MRAAIFLTLGFTAVTLPQTSHAQAPSAVPTPAAAPTQEVCAAHYGDAMKESPSKDPISLYNAACCYALAGDKDTALDLLGRSIDAGYRNADHMAADPDLVTLHGDPRWAPLNEKIRAAEAAYRKSVNTELLEIYEKDQGERASLNFADQEAMKAVAENDRKRRERVRQILAAGGAKAGDDYFHAAMVFQHGGTSDDFKQAKELAEKAFELNPDLNPARWLSAAAHDRWLQSLGKPQIYGTQFRRAEGGAWTLEPIDESAVTDEQRRKLNVPPLAEAKKQLERMNQEDKAKAAPPKTDS